MRESSDCSLSTKVYNWLLQQLLSNRLKPGDKLNRRQVATDVGVSVAPVLEAMVQLEAEGFLETLPRRSTRVRQIDTAEIHGRFLLREAIEVQAARRYCGAAVAAEAEDLDSLAEAVDCSDSHDLENWQAEIRFHRALVLLAECPVLTQAFDQVMRHSLFYMANQFLAPPARKSDPHSHQRLLRRLQRHDPDAADRAMRRHLEARMAGLAKQVAG